MPLYSLSSSIISLPNNPDHLLSSSIPFPPLSWWQMALHHNKVLFDPKEHYQKMSYRNRYYLAGPQGKQLLSVPLEKGRNQHTPMERVRIDNKSNWQVNHWRTLTSLYQRAPYFEHFSEKIRPLFLNHFEFLYDWNQEGIQLISRLFEWAPDYSEAVTYQPAYPENFLDIRPSFLPRNTFKNNIRYHQVFEERCGFLADCSILDLLFCEGKYGHKLLRDNAG